MVNGFIVVLSEKRAVVSVVCYMLHVQFY